MPRAFPLSLPPPVDRIFGNEIIQEYPHLLQGDPIHNVSVFIKERVVYYLVEDGAANEWVPPRQVLAEGRGNCEDVALLSLSILSAAGVPGGLAFFFSTEEGKGHTVAYFPVNSCCDSFVRVVEANHTGVNEWEAGELSGFKSVFKFPEWEKVWGP